MTDVTAMHRHPDRREFLAIGTGLFVVLSLPVALRRRTELVKRTFPVMGTVAELQVAHPDVQVAERAIDAAIAELQRVERMMTRFTATSDVGRVNGGAAREAVTVTPESGTLPPLVTVYV